MAGKKAPQLFGIPDFTQLKSTNKNFRTNYWNAFSYAHYELANDALKKETLKYLKTIKSDNHDRAKDLNDSLFVSVGKFCYIFNHGGDFIDNVEENLNNAIGDMITEYENSKKRIKAMKLENEIEDNKEEIAKDTNVVTIQDRLKEKASEAATEIDLWIDERMINKKLPAKDISEFLGLFSRFNLKSGHMRYLLLFFENDRDEISNALTSKDPDVRESYAGYTKTSLKNLNLFFQNLYAAVEQHTKTVVVKRPAKIKKPTDINKLVSKLKYLKEDITLGLQSLNPVHIPGAQEVWIYNTKTRKLGCLKSRDQSGLSVKGSSITNITTESIEKTLRKPAEALAEFKKASKAKLRTFLKELTTLDTTSKGKINEYCIILRIDK